jgi:hypothetical protein
MLFEPAPGKTIPVPGHRRWLATVGSVGSRATAIRRPPSRCSTPTPQQITFHRVPYDVAPMVALARAPGRARPRRSSARSRSLRR